MQELRWLDSHLSGNLQAGVDRANQLYWNLSIEQTKDQNHWLIKGGEAVLLKTDSRESVDAFLYGMGLAYAVLPHDIFGQLRESVQKLVGD